jgi:nucleoside 2-deoxyribosyltransferase
MVKIYTASSWRNKYYVGIVKRLKEEGFAVYDFRSAISTEGQKLAFDWKQIDPDWERWDIEKYLSALECNELARNAFESDLRGMEEADICLLILPCGKSSHLEAGYMKGMGKDLYIYMPELERAELTYKLANLIYKNLDQLISDLKEWARWLS